MEYTVTAWAKNTTAYIHTHGMGQKYYRVRFLLTSRGVVERVRLCDFSHEGKKLILKQCNASVFMSTTRRGKRSPRIDSLVWSVER